MRPTVGYIATLLLIILLIGSCGKGECLYCPNPSRWVTSTDPSLDSISLSTPNVLLDVESRYAIIYLTHFDLFQTVNIKSYLLEVWIDDQPIFDTDDMSFVEDHIIWIPKSLFLQQDKFIESIVEYKLQMTIDNASEAEITIDGLWLMVTCDRQFSGEIELGDCRYSYDLIPSGFGETPPNPCF